LDSLLIRKSLYLGFEQKEILGKLDVDGKILLKINPGEIDYKDGKCIGHFQDRIQYLASVNIVTFHKNSEFLHYLK
jgi:predicted phosphatase